MDLAGAASEFAHNTSAWLTISAFAALALLVAACVPRRRVLTGLAGVSLAVVLGLTLVPNGGWSRLGFESGALHSVVTNLEPHRSALLGWLVNADGPANVLLYLPAGLFLTLVTHAPARVAVGLTALSFAIECWQATLTTRVGSFDDVVANGLGALIGAAVAGVAVLVWRAFPRRRQAVTGTGW